MAESKLSAAFILIYDLKKTQEEKRLKQWNSGSNNWKGQGNLGSILYEILKQRCINVNGSGLSIYQVNQLLDALASKSLYSTLDSSSSSSLKSSKNQQTKSSNDILYELFHHASPIEAKWLTRIILKNLCPIDFTPNSIFAVIHPFTNALYALYLYI